MNERIKELAEQAQQYAEYVTPQGFEWFDTFKEKFAELLIRECSRIAKVNQAEDMGWDIGEILLEHFGVEEPKGWVCPKCGVDRTKQVCPSGYNSLLTGHCPMIGVAQ